MSLHNIIGSERSGPHFVIRQIRALRRRTFGHVVLEAIGGVVLLVAVFAGLMAVLS